MPFWVTWQERPPERTTNMCPTGKGGKGGGGGGGAEGDGYGWPTALAQSVNPVSYTHLTLPTNA